MGNVFFRQGRMDVADTLYRQVITFYFSYTAGHTVNPLYNNIHYNSKLQYNMDRICTKISGSCIFSLTVPCYSLGKHTFRIFKSVKYTFRIFKSVN